MIKRVSLCLFFAFVLSTAAHAQATPAADLTLGFSSMWVGKGYTFFLNGGGGSAALYANQWFGFVGDFGLHHADPGVSLTTETYMLGPRFSYRRRSRFVPFGQVLVGGLHASAVTTGFTDAANAFAFGAGGGVDFGPGRGGRIVLRPQLEYLGFRARSETTGVIRTSISVVFRIGRRS
jgi:hypothetical protein